MTDSTLKIMVATDGSKTANNAVKYAANMAKNLSAEILLFHVASYKKVGYWGFVDKHFKKEMVSEAHGILRAAEKIVAGYNVPCKVLTREAEKSPYLTIVDVLENKKEITMLVLGDTGKESTSQNTPGTTPQHVLQEVAKRNLPLTVVVVPHNANADFMS